MSILKRIEKVNHIIVVVILLFPCGVYEICGQDLIEDLWADVEFYIANEEYGNALILLEDLMFRPSERVHALEGMGLIFFKIGDLEQATTIFEELIRIPSFESYANELVDLYFKQKEYLKVVELSEDFSDVEFGELAISMIQASDRQSAKSNNRGLSEFSEKVEMNIPVVSARYDFQVADSPPFLDEVDRKYREYKNDFFAAVEYRLGQTLKIRPFLSFEDIRSENNPEILVEYQLQAYGLGGEFEKILTDTFAFKGHIKTFFTDTQTPANFTDIDFGSKYFYEVSLDRKTSSWQTKIGVRQQFFVNPDINDFSIDKSIRLFADSTFRPFEFIDFNLNFIQIDYTGNFEDYERVESNIIVYPERLPNLGFIFGTEREYRQENENIFNLGIDFFGSGLNSRIYSLRILSNANTKTREREIEVDGFITAHLGEYKVDFGLSISTEYNILDRTDILLSLTLSRAVN